MQCDFGMKIHVGADIRPGLAHAVSVMPAYTSDISQLPHLIRETTGGSSVARAM